MHTIENTIQIAATPKSVLEALTTKTGIQGWWTPDVECDSDKREVTYRFVKPEGEMAVTFQLVSSDETGLVMKCIRQKNNADWLGTTLAFKPVLDGAKTRVELSHAGYPAKNDLYDNCVKGWGHFLGSLQRFVETGTGSPFGKA